MLRGGPKALLSTPAAPNKFTGGAGEKVQPARLWLEILAVYETFGSLTSGEVPTLIGPGQNDWWFDTSGMSTYHRYSVEQVFGMSRSMIALVATVRREVPVIFDLRGGLSSICRFAHSFVERSENERSFRPIACPKFLFQRWTWV